MKRSVITGITSVALAFGLIGCGKKKSKSSDSKKDDKPKETQSPEDLQKLVKEQKAQVDKLTAEKKELEDRISLISASMSDAVAGKVLSKDDLLAAITEFSDSDLIKDGSFDGVRKTLKTAHDKVTAANEPDLDDPKSLKAYLPVAEEGWNALKAGHEAALKVFEDMLAAAKKDKGDAIKDLEANIQNLKKATEAQAFAAVSLYLTDAKADLNLDKPLLTTAKLRLEKAKKEHSAKVKQLEEQNKALAATNESLTKDNAELKERLDSEPNEFQKVYYYAIEKNISLNEGIKNGTLWDNVLAELKKDKDLHDGFVQTAKDTIEKTQGVVNKAEAEVAELQKKLDGFKGSNADYYDLKETLNNAETSLKQAKEQHEAALDHLKVASDDLTDALDALDANEEQLKEEKDKLKIAQTAVNNAIGTDDYAQRVEERNEIEALIATLTAKLEENEVKHFEADKAVTDAKSVADEADAVRKEAQSAKDKAENDISSYAGTAPVSEIDNAFSGVSDGNKFIAEKKAIIDSYSKEIEKQQGILKTFADLANYTERLKKQ